MHGNLYARFLERCRAQPERVALRQPGGGSWTYAELDRAAATMARGLATLGVQSGDRVSVQVAKSPQALFLYLACLRGGYVFHPLNPAYTDQELDFFLHDAQPAVVVCDPERAAALRTLCSDIALRELLELDGAGAGSLIDACSGESGEHEVAPCDAGTMACLLYSSGTTGRPKGIVLTHGNLLSNADALVDSWGFSDADVLLHALPIFHVHGLFVATHCALLSGACMVWLPGFSVDGVISALPHCTVMMGVPTFYTRLLDSPAFTAGVAANIRLFISGSAPLREATFRAFEQRTGQRILERYGMTETGMNTSNPLEGVRKAGTVGHPLPGVELRIVDEEGRRLPQGEIGLIEVRGANVFPEYWHLPEKTAADFAADGFFNTGDKGMIDEDGYVVIVGRERDMVISGGLNVYPRELELLLDSLDGVAESAVIGVPHPDFGEAVVALLVPAAEDAPSARQVIETLRPQLAAFKLPKHVECIDALPRNSMGKVQKNLLRERFRDLFARGDR